MRTSERAALLAKITRKIVSFDNRKPLLVGIDGVSGAGKTTLANELEPILEQKGRHVLRASVDGFHHPQARRVARGEFCPHGYYDDSFDYDFLVKHLLAPLRDYRDGIVVQTQRFDFRSNRPTKQITKNVPHDTVVLFEGVLLFRPELEPYWDLKIFVDIDFDESLNRGIRRDAAWMTDVAAVKQKYERRYIPGQKMYLRRVEPLQKADVAFNNNDPAQPIVLRS